MPEPTFASPWSTSPIRASVSARYALAVGIFAVALLLRFAVLPVEARLAFLTFYAATIFAFYLCGSGPGVLVVVLCAAAGAYIFTPPQWSLAFTPAGILSTLAFLITGLLVGWVVQRLQATSARLHTALTELAASERRYRAILEDQTDAICRFRPDGTMLYVNDAYCRMFGVARATIIGRSWQPVALPDDLPAIDAKLATLSPSQPVVVIENRVFGAGGCVRWGQFVNHAFYDADGKLVEIQSVGRDITERKALEAELVETTARVRDLYDNAPCGYYSLDAQGRYVHVNAVVLAWLGCSREDVVGRLGPADFFTDEGKQLFARCFPKLKADGRIDGLEFDLVGRHGEMRRVSVAATAIRGRDGNFLMSRSVMYDITELHRARGELRRINREQAAMLDNDLVGIVRLRHRRTVWHNRAFERMFGYAPGELAGAPSRLLYFDDESFRAIGEAAYPILRAGGHYRAQLRLRRKSGEAIWVDISGVLLSEAVDESLWLMTDITSTKEYELRIEAMAFHDGLTALPNRLLLDDRLAQALRLCQRTGATLAVCYLDLDGFKSVNDARGHVAGDRVLKVIAERIGHHVRGNDTVARVGGDEFVLLLMTLERPDECTAILERVLASIGDPIPFPGEAPVRISASIGVAFYPRDGADAGALIALADRAMYEAKSAGRNRVSYFTQPASQRS